MSGHLGETAGELKGHQQRDPRVDRVRDLFGGFAVQGDGAAEIARPRQDASRFEQLTVVHRRGAGLRQLLAAGPIRRAPADGLRGGGALGQGFPQQAGHLGGPPVRAPGQKRADGLEGHRLEPPLAAAHGDPRQLSELVHQRAAADPGLHASPDVEPPQRRPFRRPRDQCAGREDAHRLPGDIGADGIEDAALPDFGFEVRHEPLFRQARKLEQCEIAAIGGRDHARRPRSVGRDDHGIRAVRDDMPVGDQERGTDPRRARHRIEAGNREDRLPDAADRGGVGAVLGRFPPCPRLRRSRLRIEGESDHAPLSGALQRNVERLARVADDGERRDRVARRANSAGADFQYRVAGRDARPGRRTACAHHPDHGRGEVAPGAPEPPARRRVTDFAVGNQRIDDPQQQFGRDGEIDAYIGVALGGEDRRHHADQAAFRVDQRAARHAGVRGGIRLDEVPPPG